MACSASALVQYIQPFHFLFAKRDLDNLVLMQDRQMTWLPTDADDHPQSSPMLGLKVGYTSSIHVSIRT